MESGNTQGSPPELAGGSEGSSEVNHIRLYNAWCVLCRHPVWPGDRVCTLLGLWDESRCRASTMAYDFPSQGYPFTYVTLREDYQQQPLRLCREPLCRECPRNTESFTYHLGCWKMVQKYHQPSLNSPGASDESAAAEEAEVQETATLSQRQIWNLGLWTQGMPHLRFHAGPSFEAAAAMMSNPVMASPAVMADPLLKAVRQLPVELQHLILEYSLWAPLWRYPAALYRRAFYSPVVDGANEGDEGGPAAEFRVNEISWRRGVGVTDYDPDGIQTRICLDEFGIRFIENKTLETPRAQKQEITNAWYVLENCSKYANAQALVKGDFLRIDGVRPLTLYDDLNLHNVSSKWYDAKLKPKRVRCVNLENITGLTVFCDGGKAYWVHAHHGDSVHAPFPPQDHLHPSERRSYIPFYFPLAEGEEIDMVHMIGARTGARLDCTMIVSTTTGRSAQFGAFRPVLHISTARCLNSRRPLYMLFPDPDPPYVTQNLSVVTVPRTPESATQRVFEEHAARRAAVLMPWLGEPDGAGDADDDGGEDHVTAPWRAAPTDAIGGPPGDLVVGPGAVATGDWMSASPFMHLYRLRVRQPFPPFYRPAEGVKFPAAVLAMGPLYVSSMPLRNVRLLRLFYRRVSGPLPPQSILHGERNAASPTPGSSVSGSSSAASSPSPLSDFHVGLRTALDDCGAPSDHRSAPATATAATTTTALLGPVDPPAAAPPDRLLLLGMVAEYLDGSRGSLGCVSIFRRQHGGPLRPNALDGELAETAVERPARIVYRMGAAGAEVVAHGEGDGETEVPEGWNCSGEGPVKAWAVCNASGMLYFLAL